MCIYFDPLNLSCIPQNIQEYMPPNSKSVDQINYTIQNPFSNFCGLLSILCIMMHVNNIPLIQGITSFHEASEQNDNKCVRMLEKLFKLYYLEQLWQSKIISNYEICIYWNESMQIKISNCRFFVKKIWCIATVHYLWVKEFIFFSRSGWRQASMIGWMIKIICSL